MQPCSVSDENKMINAFLNHFNYINKATQKRAGFSFFCCKKLTARIENTSIKLIRDLSELMTQPSSLEAKSKRLIVEISSAVGEVRKARFDEAAVSTQYEAHDIPLSRHRIVVDFDYKVAYSNGKFEKNLAAGLQAAIPFMKASLQKTAAVLVEDILDYKPERVIVRDNSLIP